MKTVDELAVESGAKRRTEYSHFKDDGTIHYDFTESQLTAFAEAYHAQKEAEKWISVDDGLPEPYVEVLVFPQPTDYCITAEYGKYNKSETNCFFYGEYEHGYGHCWYETKPTHWQPLPPLPISKDGE